MGADLSVLLFLDIVLSEQQGINPVVVDNTNMNGTFRIEVKDNANKPIFSANVEVLSTDAGEDEVVKILTSLTTDVSNRKVEVTQVNA